MATTIERYLGGLTGFTKRKVHISSADSTPFLDIFDGPVTIGMIYIINTGAAAARNYLKIRDSLSYVVGTDPHDFIFPCVDDNAAGETDNYIIQFDPTDGEFFANGLSCAFTAAADETTSAAPSDIIDAIFVEK